MRLNKNEIEAIKQLSDSCFGKNSEVLLFGSRVDDSLMGGDIDLYVIPEKKLLSDELYKQRIQFLSLLKMRIGDQKIDLIIARDRKRAIEREALKTGVTL